MRGATLPHVTRYLFVYGTLRRAANHPMHRALATSSFIGEGHVGARLFDLGSYPGMMLSRDPDARVTGEVYELPAEAAAVVLQTLDEYEGVGATSGVQEYERQIVDVSLVTGQTLSAWAYVLVDARRARARIDSGDMMNATVVVDTPRLQLRAALPAEILVLIENPDHFAAMAGIQADPALRGFLVTGDVSPEWLASLRHSPKADAWQHGFFVVHRDDQVIVGMGGFKGRAGDDGSVEIAYGIVPSYERRGLATEVARALVDFARGEPGVVVVRAHTVHTNPGSIRVLEKTGFRFVGDVIDPDDGPVMRWEIAAS